MYFNILDSNQGNEKAEGHHAFGLRTILIFLVATSATSPLSAPR